MRRLALQPRSHPLAACLLAAALTVAPTSQARAFGGNANAKIMLHALGATTKGPCSRTQNIPSTCSAYNAGVNNLSVHPSVYYTYLLVVNGSLAEGVAGMQCGLAYEGGVAAGGGNAPINVYSWTLCATLEFTSSSPAWPNPGSGILITWNAFGPQCSAPPGSASIGAVGVAGYFYMAGYGPGQMRVTPHPVDGRAKVANCGSIEDVIHYSPLDSQTNLGAIGFGNTGINPCGREGQHPGVCNVTGPDELVSGQSGIQYQCSIGFDNYEWLIAGSATFDSPPGNQDTATITAGAPGQFTIRCDVASGSGSAWCDRTVTVRAPVATLPTSWGRIKTLARSN